MFDDGARDVLRGDDGPDWYFASLSGGVLDHLFGLGRGERVEELGPGAP